MSRTTRSYLNIFSSVIAIGALTAAQSGNAQEAHGLSAGNAAAATDQIDDIVVTARKREETLQSIPVVANVISQKQLEVFQTNDLKAVATLVPGLSLGTSILSVGTLTSLRGVGTSSLDPGVDSSIALNIDGMTLSQGLAFSSGMFDVAQIDVLKGPQSLFFGKSSPGGVISLRSADPTDKFELIARAGYEFEARERRVELIASGPVSETLKLRLAGTAGKQDGFFRNPAIGIPALGSRDPQSRRLGPSKDYKLRATLLWDPTPDLSGRLKVNKVVDDSDYSGVAQNVVCPDGVGPVNGLQFIDKDCVFDRNVPVVDYDPTAFPGIPHNGVPYNKTKQDYGTLEIGYALTPALQLTSATGYYQVRADSLVNAAMTSAGMGVISAVNEFKRRQFTQEFRLASQFEGPLDFMIGGYIEQGRFSDLVTIGGNTALKIPALRQKGKKTVDIDTYSLFGQALYDIAPDVELTAGIRWTDETRSQVGLDLMSGAPVSVRLPVPRIHASNFAPEITLAYRPSDDLTFFAALKQGYKSGSFNVSTPPFTGENNAFGDEKVQGGEIGLKSRFLDRALTFNVAGYYYSFKGLQVGANVQADGGITVTRTVNAGKARIFGLEAEASYRPQSVPGLNVRGSVNWNNNKYTSLINVPCYGGQTIAEGCSLLYSIAANRGAGGYTAQDRSGIGLVRAPTWSAIFGAEYRKPISEAVDLVFASNNQYSSRFVNNLGFLHYQKAYLKTDFTFMVEDRDDRWQLAFIGRNLTNKITSGNCANSDRQGGLTGGQITGATGRGPAGVDEIGCYSDRGRELWTRFTLRFQ